MSTIRILVILQIVASSFALGDQSTNVASQSVAGIGSNNTIDNNIKLSDLPKLDANKIGLEPRASDRTFVKDIVDRLHALDADIGKLLFNSSSMYAPSDQALVNLDQSKGGEKFTEVLNDLDSLQDEIGVLVSNATRTRQYNILVRLRPMNNILYRIRHNLHLMRNSLVAITTVSNLERFGNSVLDSTLQAFMRPDANLNEEIGDSGNYDINLDGIDDVKMNSTTSIDPSLHASVAESPQETSLPTSTSTTTTTTPTTTTTTTTTPAPTSSTTTTSAPTSHTRERPGRRTTQRPATRRAPHRHNNRRTTTTTTQAPTSPRTE